MDPIAWVDRLFGNSPIAQYILWLVFIIVVLWLTGRIIRRTWAPLRKFITTIDALDELPNFTTETKATLEKLRAQVENSHSTNLRDELTDALESLEGLHGRLDRVETGVAGLYGKVDALQASDESTAEHIREIEATIPRNQLGRYIKKEENNDEHT